MTIDGSYGEGGGQILRSAICLSAIEQRPVRIVKIRAGRPKPGLAAQHLTTVRALAALCGAALEGDELGSSTLTFAPAGSVRPGDYLFDVAEARAGGSAGATSLVLQTAALPLALAHGRSSLTLRGGTHVPWSPPYDYLKDVWVPTLRRTGVRLSVELHAWGWYPRGQGEIYSSIQGLDRGSERGALKPIDLTDPGRLERISGRAVAANLPQHIALRMSERASALTADLGADVSIRAETVQAACPGAGIFFTAEHEHVRCGFSALGKRGKPAEQVAEEAVQALRRHRSSGAALDSHLPDQILLPLAFAEGPSRFSAECISRHFETNAWVLEQFDLARFAIERRASGAGVVTVSPRKARG
ncbi:MAG: RNA 3'-terminal phosphate cyclase [Kiloniellales bacterium]|nr:RNA 3'-terminal phosphate cyclase [Kiloniellales bacterium]